MKCSEVYLSLTRKLTSPFTNPLEVVHGPGVCGPRATLAGTWPSV